MPTGERLWRTEKGDLVEEGHPEAMLLAYGEGDDLSEEDEGNVRRKAAKASGESTPAKKAPAKKAASKAANKQAPKSADKQAAPPENK